MNLIALNLVHTDYAIIFWAAINSYFKVIIYFWGAGVGGGGVLDIFSWLGNITWDPFFPLRNENSDTSREKKRLL